ncbi:MAG: DUF3047 domain-containing protein [Piscinibacter sp.]|uniref:DUF3047 domain-containing protein n=1 Tax=Piscinibacter sp. TaxID=1903157 RepID=UPI003D0AF0B7
MKSHLIVLGLLALAACSAPPTSAPVTSVAQAGPWAGWNDYALPGKRSTVYRMQRDGSRFIVQAQAESSASMFRRRLRVDAAQLARVQFSWRVPGLIARADLAEAEVSDSPVRLVLAFDGDHGRLSARARMLFELAQALTGEPPPYATLMYAWDNHAAPGTVIVGPRTDRVRKIVVETGPSRLGQWLQYDRDLAADYRLAFGEEPGPLIGVALMTDADNTGSRAAGQYGEVRLISRDGKAL